MADAPSSPTTPAPDPKPSPPPQAPPPAAKPAVPSTPEPKPEPAPARETATETKIPDSLDPKLRIEIEGGDPKGVSLGDLVTNYQKTGPLSAKALEVARLVEGADKKDPGSILGLFGLNPDGTDPNATPDPALPGPADSPKVAALEAELREIKGVINEITGVRDQVQLRTAITTHAEKLPMLAADPRRGADDVQRQLVEVDSIMRMKEPGYDPSTLSPEQQTKRLQVAFERAENNLLSIVQRYNPEFKPPQQEGAAAAEADPPAQGAKDDQPPSGEKTGPPDVIPAKLNFVDGKTINQAGQPVRQSATGEIVPQEMPDPGAASAGAVPPGAPSNEGGLTFREKRKQAMRVRRQEMQTSE